MSGADFDALRPHLVRVALDVRDALEAPGEPIRYVYFPEPSVCSVVAVTPKGERIEVGLIGPEGMSGMSVLHGSDRTPLQTFTQVAGQAIRIATEPLRDALGSSATLRPLLLRYSQAFSLQLSYTALANGRCTIDERLARWLLMCNDRLDGDIVPLTHEFLALMLGVRRAGVTTALHVLERSSVIAAARGRIEILNRAGLQEATGDSYGVPEAEYERLMSVP